jgi:hypothetical protein
MSSKGSRSRDTGEARAVGRRGLPINLLASVMTVVSAVLLKWDIGDMLWGLWACSLWVGYVYVIVGIFSSVYRENHEPPRGSIGDGLKMLVFFTIHFGMFHFVYSVFLNKFFPLIIVKSGVPNIFLTAAVTLRSYWPLILATFVSRFSDLPFSGIRLEQKAVVSSKPYKNVIRMHLFILVFLGLDATGVPHPAIYPVILLYFIPWGSLWREFKRKSAKEDVRDLAAGD